MVAMYPRTLDGISALVGVLDLVGGASEDDGFIIEPVSLTSPVSGDLIGVINFDGDRHAYFIPEDEVDADETYFLAAEDETYILTEKGQRVVNIMREQNISLDEAIAQDERQNP